MNQDLIEIRKRDYERYERHVWCQIHKHKQTIKCHFEKSKTSLFIDEPNPYVRSRMYQYARQNDIKCTTIKGEDIKSKRIQFTK